MQFEVPHCHVVSVLYLATSASRSLAKALYLWLMLFFVSLDISAYVWLYPSGSNTGSLHTLTSLLRPMQERKQIHNGT